MKVPVAVTIAIIVFVHPLFAQNYNYLNSADNFEFETSAVNEERDIISNLVILMDYDKYNRDYQAMLRGLNRLARIYKPDSLSLLVRELELFESHHPFLKLYENKKSGKSEYALWRPFKSQQFKRFFIEQVNLFKKYERLSGGSEIIASQIYQYSQYYLTNHAYREAKILLKWLKKEYPNTYFVQRRFVDNRLQSIRLEVGKKLPVTSFTTMEGRELHIPSLDHDLILIAYIDIYANDYKADLSNAIEVAKQMQNIHLIVLLNSNIPTKEINRLEESTTINTSWVLADDKLKRKLGLSDYSSNLLVSQERRIIAKDMNFDRLPEEVAFFWSNSSSLAKK